MGSLSCLKISQPSAGRLGSLLFPQRRSFDACPPSDPQDSSNASRPTSFSVFLALRRALAWIIFALTAIGTEGAAPKVLVVHSFGSDAPRFTSASIAFETELTQRFGQQVDLDDVSLDHARYAAPDMEEAL